MRGSISWRQDLTALLYLAPFLAVFAVFIAWPVVYSFWISLHRVTIYTDFYDLFNDMQWAGFANYYWVLSDPVFWWSVILTVIYAALTIFGGIALSLTLALALRRAKAGIGLMRAGFFLPNVFDIFVVGVIWLMLYTPRSGIVSQLLDTFGADALAERGVLATAWLTLPGIALAVILKNAGFGMVLFIVSLNNINPSVFEAADVDGASPTQKFKMITLPLLRPTILFLAITGLVVSLNSFGEIYAMTDAKGGGAIQFSDEAPIYTPEGVGHAAFGDATLQSAKISAFHLYKTFEESSYGRAAAISFVLLVIALMISWLNFKLLKPQT